MFEQPKNHTTLLLIDTGEKIYAESASELIMCELSEKAQQIAAQRICCKVVKVMNKEC